MIFWLYRENKIYYVNMENNKRKVFLIFKIFKLDRLFVNLD